MRIKIIAAIFICFYSGVSFSQTKKLLHSFERHFETSRSLYPQSCWGGGQYKRCKEDYAISLFSDSTFIISYSRKGNLHPELLQILGGKFYKNNTGIYLIRDSAINTFSKSHLVDGGGLEEVLNIGIPLRVEYSDEAMSFNNWGGPFLIFSKVNILTKYKKSKPAPVFTPILSFLPNFQTTQ